MAVLATLRRVTGADLNELIGGQQVVSEGDNPKMADYAPDMTPGTRPDA